MTKRTLRAWLVTASLALCAAAPAFAQDEAPTVKSRHDVLKDAFRDVADKARAATVKIFNGGRESGYGVLIDGGYILTSESAVTEARKVRFSGLNGVEGEATLRGVDRNFHVALLSFELAGETPVAELGRSKELFVGQFVITVGLAETPLAAGVVSALERNVVAAPKQRGGGNVLADLFGMNNGNDGPDQDYTRVVQHDSKVKEDHYGSPVYDAKARLMGINVEAAYRGSSYFVAIDDIRTLMDDLKSGKLAEPAPPAKPAEPVKPRESAPPAPAPANDSGFLGVTVEGGATSGALKEQGFAFAAKVTEVAGGSGAAKAGLKPGDAIVSVNGNRFESFEQFAALVRGRKVGDVLTLEVFRDGWANSVKVTLGRRPG